VYIRFDPSGVLAVATMIQELAMESDRFDVLTRSIASRRSFVAKAGGGGLGAALLAALGLREEAEAASTCLLDVRLFVRVGPSASIPLISNQTKNGQLIGQLRLRISSKGDLGGSSFALPDGASFPVVGSVSSHLIGLRIALAQGRTLVLQGVDENAVASCTGALDGGLVGPQEGDLGDWHASVVPTATTPTATAGNQGVAPTPIQGSSSGTGGETPPTDTPPAPTDTSTSVPDTPTPTPTEIVCGECQTPLARGTGGAPCNPIADNTPCSGGLCCDGICGDLSDNPNHCGACGNSCVSGCCHGGVCCPLCNAGETLCGATCVNLNNDASNCGACGNVCPSGQICFGGGCATDNRGGNGTGGCPPGERNCGGVCTKLKICP
jgi:hypothetical protein